MESIVAVTATYAVLVTALAPLLLRRGTWWLRRPQLALCLWHLSFVSGALAALSSVVVLVTFLATHSDDAPSTGHELVVEGIIVAIIAVGVAIFSFALHQIEVTLSRILDLRRSMSVLGSTIASRVDSRGTYDLVVLDTHEHVACSVRGHRPQIFISEGLASSLESAELEAIVCHESAHLERRHFLLTETAELACACTPWLPASRELRKATALLVELAADDHACRTVGHRATTSALTKLAAANRADPSQAPGLYDLRAARVTG